MVPSRTLRCRWRAACMLKHPRSKTSPNVTATPYLNPWNTHRAATPGPTQMPLTRWRNAPTWAPASEVLASACAKWVLRVARARGKRGFGSSTPAAKQRRGCFQKGMWGRGCRLIHTPHPTKLRCQSRHPFSNSLLVGTDDMLWCPCRPFSSSSHSRQPKVRVPERVLRKRRLPEHARAGLDAGGHAPGGCRGFRGGVRAGHAGGVVDVGLAVRVRMRVRLLVGGESTRVPWHIHSSLEAGLKPQETIATNRRSAFQSWPGRVALANFQRL